MQFITFSVSVTVLSVAQHHWKNITLQQINWSIRTTKCHNAIVVLDMQRCRQHATPLTKPSTHRFVKDVLTNASQIRIEATRVDKRRLSQSRSSFINTYQLYFWTSQFLYRGVTRWPIWTIGWLKRSPHFFNRISKLRVYTQMTGYYT